MALSSELCGLRAPAAVLATGEATGPHLTLGSLLITRYSGLGAMMSLTPHGGTKNTGCPWGSRYHDGFYKGRPVPNLHAWVDKALWNKGEQQMPPVCRCKPGYDLLWSEFYNRSCSRKSITKCCNSRFIETWNWERKIKYALAFHAKIYGAILWKKNISFIVDSFFITLWKPERQISEP